MANIIFIALVAAVVYALYRYGAFNGIVAWTTGVLGAIATWFSGVGDYLAILWDSLF